MQVDGMEDIKTQCKEVSDLWDKITKAGDDEMYDPYLDGMKMSQLTEAISILTQLVGRVRSPQGFAPSFQVSKAFAATSLGMILPALKQIHSGHPNHFKQLVHGLNNAISAFHTMIALSDVAINDANMTLKFQEQIALMQTAERELTKKLETLSSACEAALQIQHRLDETEGLRDLAQEMADHISTVEDEVSSSLTDVNTRTKTVTDFAGNVAALTASGSKAIKEVEDQTTSLGDLTKQAEQIRDQINALMPEAASAGLAHAFQKRRLDLNFTKWVWVSLFAVSIVFLAGIATHALFHLPGTSDEFLKQIAFRLPLSAPFIWLGWFSAAQYGNTIRVQEDYAFKEATSSAFIGYRDHMEHLKNVSSQEGLTALHLLAVSTIEVLGREPLRIYSKVHKDISPAQQFVDLFRTNSSSANKSE